MSSGSKTGVIVGHNKGATARTPAELLLHCFLERQRMLKKTLFAFCAALIAGVVFISPVQAQQMRNDFVEEMTVVRFNLLTAHRNLKATCSELTTGRQWCNMMVFQADAAYRTSRTVWALLMLRLYADPMDRSSSETTYKTLIEGEARIVEDDIKKFSSFVTVEQPGAVAVQLNGVLTELKRLKAVIEDNR